MIYLDMQRVSSFILLHVPETGVLDFKIKLFGYALEEEKTRRKMRTAQQGHILNMW